MGKTYKQEIIKITKNGKFIYAMVCQNDDGQDRKEKIERYKNFE